MKATLNANGVIAIEAENGLEEYALQKWSEDAFVNGESLLGFWNASKLIINSQTNLLPD